MQVGISTPDDSGRTSRATDLSETETDSTHSSRTLRSVGPSQHSGFAPGRQPLKNTFVGAENDITAQSSGSVFSPNSAEDTSPSSPAGRKRDGAVKIPLRAATLSMFLLACISCVVITMVPTELQARSTAKDLARKVIYNTVDKGVCNITAFQELSQYALTVIDDQFQAGIEGSDYHASQGHLNVPQMKRVFFKAVSRVHGIVYAQFGYEDGSFYGIDYTQPNRVLFWVKNETFPCRTAWQMHLPSLVEYKTPYVVEDGDRCVYDPRERPWYLQLNSTEPRASDPYPFTSDEVVAVSFGRQFRDVTGRPFAVLAVDLSLAPIHEALSSLDLLSGGAAMVFTMNGTVLGTSNTESAVTSFTKDLANPSVELLTVCDVRTAILRRGMEHLGGCRAMLSTALAPNELQLWDGGDMVVAVKDISMKGVASMRWRLLVAVPFDSVTGDIETRRNATIAAIVAVVVVVMFFVFLGINYVVNDILVFEEHMSYVAALDFSHKNELPRSSRLAEVEKMLRAFRRMSSQLEEVKCYVPKQLFDFEDEEIVNRKDSIVEVVDIVELDEELLDSINASCASITHQNSSVGIGTASSSGANASASSMTRSASSSGGRGGGRNPLHVSVTGDSAAAPSKEGRPASPSPHIPPAPRARVLGQSLTGTTGFGGKHGRVVVGTVIVLYAELVDVDTLHPKVYGFDSQVFFDIFCRIVGQSRGQVLRLGSNSAYAVWGLSRRHNAASQGMEFQAVNCAVEIRNAVDAKMPNSATVVIGLATGKAATGIVGTTTDKNFICEGHVRITAIMLSSLCKLIHTKILTTGAIANNPALQPFMTRPVDLIKDSLQVVENVYEVVKRYGMDGDEGGEEWMYALQSQEEKKEESAFRAGFFEMISGSYESARKKFEEAIAKHECDANDPYVAHKLKVFDGKTDQPDANVWPRHLVAGGPQVFPFEQSDEASAGGGGGGEFHRSMSLNNVNTAYTT